MIECIFSFAKNTAIEIVKKARTIIAETAAIEDLVKTYSDPMSGRGNIGLIPTVAPYLLPLIVQPINRTYPQLEIILHEVQTEVMLKKLGEGYGIRDEHRYDISRMG